MLLQKSELDICPIRVVRGVLLAVILFLAVTLPPQYWPLAIALVVLAAINTNDSVTAGLKNTWHAAYLILIVMGLTALVFVIGFFTVRAMTFGTLNTTFIVAFCVAGTLAADIKMYHQKHVANNSGVVQCGQKPKGRPFDI